MITETPKKLGFGLMRLPRKGLLIDIEQTSKMVDMFLDAGFTYFDTAFVYPGSEEATRKALVERHPRESYTLATKLYAAAAPVAPTKKVAQSQLNTSLKRTGAGYIDYYLLHTLKESNYKRYDKLDLWNFVREEKEKGRIRHYGFSYHGGPELLDELLDKHPDAEFVQLQINYADWESPVIKSRENYEVARKHNKPIIIMEPVQGGKLASPPSSVKEAFQSTGSDASPASYALRFAANLEGILTVLSGMSSVEQMADNISFMKDLQPLNEKELSAIRFAQGVFHESLGVPCTSCHYCTKGCPKNIPIPEIFTAANYRLEDGQLKKAYEEYTDVTATFGSKASDCIECGQCEEACPQHIKIIDRLKDCAKSLE